MATGAWDKHGNKGRNILGEVRITYLLFVLRESKLAFIFHNIQR